MPTFHSKQEHPHDRTSDKPVESAHDRRHGDPQVRAEDPTDYLQRVKEFASYLKRSPDTAKPQDVRGFQLHLTSSGAGVPKINSTISALRFFFNVTLDRPDLSRHLSTVHRPRKVPVVLSPEEVARFLEAAPGIKYKASLSVAYGAGLRVSEVAALKVSEIDWPKSLTSHTRTRP